MGKVWKGEENKGPERVLPRFVRGLSPAGACSKAVYPQREE